MRTKIISLIEPYARAMIVASVLLAFLFAVGPVTYRRAIVPLPDAHNRGDDARKESAATDKARSAAQRTANSLSSGSDLQKELKEAKNDLAHKQQELESALQAREQAHWNLFSDQRARGFLSDLSRSFIQYKAEISPLKENLGKIAAEKQKVNPGTIPPFMPYLPSCFIVISASDKNAEFANAISFSSGEPACSVQVLTPAPPPPPKPQLDADAPPPQPIKPPVLKPYIVVRYPNVADVDKLSDTHRVVSGHIIPVSSDDVERKLADALGRMANGLMTAFRNCNLDARRSHLPEGTGGMPADKWTIYIDLGSVGPCQ